MKTNLKFYRLNLEQIGEVIETSLEKIPENCNICDSSGHAVCINCTMPLCGKHMEMIIDQPYESATFNGVIFCKECVNDFL